MEYITNTGLLKCFSLSIYDQFFKELKEKQDEIQQKTGKEKKSTEYDRTVAIKFNLP